MAHIAGHDRSQTLLLPESLDDHVGLKNPVRFIDAFVDELDRAAAGFIRVTAKRTEPGDLVLRLSICRGFTFQLPRSCSLKSSTRSGSPPQYRSEPGCCGI
jgi:hypothetical protein